MHRGISSCAISARALAWGLYREPSPAMMDLVRAWTQAHASSAADAVKQLVTSFKLGVPWYRARPAQYAPAATRQQMGRGLDMGLDHAWALMDGCRGQLC